ncbi:MAG: leucyl/phenylalanyl-tRNA--protein transferase [Pseudomonadota bacterium]
MSVLHWIPPDAAPDAFPPVNQALAYPDGLLAAGGDLSAERLLAAYRRGIFPWFEEGQAILWWSPNPRTVFVPADLHRSRSLRRALQREPIRISLNTAFSDVMSACAAPRPGQDGTWITTSMMTAYHQLHTLGHAHSLEVWRNENLIGGVYGLAIGAVFFGESMFSAATNGSKFALSALAALLEKHEFALIDGQVKSPHLRSMGSIELPREEFIDRLDRHCPRRIDRNLWQKNDDVDVDIVKKV